MKKLLLLFVLSGIVAAHAQHFELGINGGAMQYHVPDYDAQQSVLAPGLSLKALYSGKNYEAGIDVSCYITDYTFYSPGSEVFAAQTAQHPFILTTGVAYRANQTIMPQKIFANRKISFGRLQTYAGLSAGYVWEIYRANAKNSAEASTFGLPQSSRSNYAVLLAGAQAGVNYTLSKHMSLNAQADIYCDDFHFPIMGGVKNVFLFPCSAGVRYKL